ncbi:GMC family oxidoreductase N-terminal domain-containing protein [Aeromicrobium sp.]|uniref:GMC family oxidoreductase n=1 Tax=Aeromicrobium sp. TaxID=1871063 RepID=UPI0025C2EE05|nr:GMC family oxidoreductase N-terminal domain-containing protein [Aeromicrobium sp.]MCK5892637.1 GMC family oxidoreductase N-terminal domain-containing protein [Aeromicrobium sp.]
MSFDYVVVGAGAAGCVLANRLSVDPGVSVLLVERGGRGRDPRLAVPRAFVFTMRSPRHTLRYPTRSGEGVPPEAWLRGQGLGGSTLVNGLMYVHGDERDYDDLESVVGDGWGPSDFARAFADMESGLLGVTVPKEGDDVSEAVIAGAVAVGLRRVADVNRSAGDRIGYTPATTSRGRRVSAATAFLRPARRRPNVTVVTGSVVERIEMTDGRATGVVLRDRAGVRTVEACREVLLCAGTIESPAILERSGIGGAEALRAAGIPRVVDSPRVGEGVVEHRGLSLQVRFRDRRGVTERLNTRPRQVREGLRYLATRQGPVATSGYDVASRFTSDPTSTAPDAHGVWVPMAIDETATELGLAPYSGLLFTGYATRPTSGGSTHVASADPSALPVITPRHLEDAAEQRTTAGILAHARQVVDASGLASHVASEVFPGPHLVEPADVVEHVRAHGGGIYHAVGSCAAGRDEGAVLDTDLRVRGVEGLRVVDASAFPHHVSGNTAAPVMALAWLAAERIVLPG